MVTNKNCHDCKHLVEIKDSNNNMITNYNCTNTRVDYSALEKYDFDFNEIGSHCFEFERKKITSECPACNKEFSYKKGDPEYSYQNIIVCSEKCKDSLIMSDHIEKSEYF